MEGFIFDILKAFIGAFFGFLFAILINRGLEKRRIKSEKKAMSKRQFQNLLHFKLLLDSVIQFCQKQSYYFNEQSDIFVKSPLDIIPLIKVASSDFKSIKAKDSESLLFAYMEFIETERPIEDYNLVFSNIEYLDQSFDEMITTFQRHIDYVDRDRQKANDYLEKISMDIAFQIEDAKLSDMPNKNDLDYLKKYDSIYFELIKEKADLRKFYDSFLLPLHETLLKDYSNTVVRQIIFRDVTSIMILFERIRTNTMIFANGLKSFEKEIEPYIEKLNVEKSKMEEINEP